MVKLTLKCISKHIFGYQGNWLNIWVLLSWICKCSTLGQHLVNQLKWQALEQLHLLCQGEIGKLHKYFSCKRKYLTMLVGLIPVLKRKKWKISNQHLMLLILTMTNDWVKKNCTSNWKWKDKIHHGMAYSNWNVIEITFSIISGMKSKIW